MTNLKRPVGPGQHGTVVRKPQGGVSAVVSSEVPLGHDWKSAEAPIDTASSGEVVRAVPDDWGCETEGEAAEMLRRQFCPVCGEGPWKSPLNHAARKHGIDKWTMRDACGLTTTESVADPDLSATFSAREKAKDHDMSALVALSLESRRQNGRRWTRAGLAKNTANVLAGSDDEIRRKNLEAARTPEARAKWRASMEARFGRPMHPGTSDPEVRS